MDAHGQIDQLDVLDSMPSAAASPRTKKGCFKTAILRRTIVSKHPLVLGRSPGNTPGRRPSWMSHDGELTCQKEKRLLHKPILGARERFVKSGRRRTARSSNTPFCPGCAFQRVVFFLTFPAIFCHVHRPKGVGTDKQRMLFFESRWRESARWRNHAD
jgi:hypothetical protein